MILIFSTGVDGSSRTIEQQSFVSTERATKRQKAWESEACPQEQSFVLRKVCNFPICFKLLAVIKINIIIPQTQKPSRSCSAFSIYARAFIVIWCTMWYFNITYIKIEILFASTFFLTLWCVKDFLGMRLASIKWNHITQTRDFLSHRLIKVIPFLWCGEKLCIVWNFELRNNLFRYYLGTSNVKEGKIFSRKISFIKLSYTRDLILIVF